MTSERERAEFEQLREADYQAWLASSNTATYRDAFEAGWTTGARRVEKLQMVLRELVNETESTDNPADMGVGTDAEVMVKARTALYVMHIQDDVAYWKGQAEAARHEERKRCDDVREALRKLISSYIGQV